ncbi:hypothetical protein [Bremerella cremea]|uniref:hypothetical protein n=1 Tax=Bremerella cremea TaxID=1031537 RepID=UPI0031EA81F7
MARFLKALQGLQSQEPEPTSPQKSASAPPEASPPVSKESQPEAVQAKIAEPKSPANQTIVLEEPVEKPAKKQPKVKAKAQPESAPVEVASAPPKESPKSAEQQQLIAKLTEQLSIVLKQRDTIAREVLQVRETLQSHDQRHEAEIVRLRDTLEEHDRSAKTIETDLKSIESELRKQLQLQEEAFAQKLREVEDRVQKQAQAQLAAAEAAKAAAVKATPPAPVAPPKAAAPSISATPAPTENVSTFRAPAHKAAPQKQIPHVEPIRKAIADLDQPHLEQEFADLSEKIFGPLDFLLLSDPQVIFVGTCVPGQSSGTAILQLAAWLSQQSCDVLVIDGAMRSKTLSEQLGLRHSPGLFEAVRRETYRQDGTYVDSASGIAFIPAGKSSFMLTTNEQDLSSLRDQIREILKSYPVVLIAGEGPDVAASSLMAQVATRTYLQATLGYLSAEDVDAAVDTYRYAGIELSGLIATKVMK